MFHLLYQLKNFNSLVDGLVTVHVCITSPDSLHALPRVDKTNVVIGAEKVIKITFQSLLD